MVIGDVHGRTSWKEWVKEKCDKYVFIGDYMDSYPDENISDDQELSNFLEIIEFKKQNKDNVILLLGNHCLHYLFFPRQYQCSRFKTKLYPKLNKIYTENRDLFQVAYQIDNHLFTHAGVVDSWYTQYFKRTEKVSDLLNTEFRNGNKYLFDISHFRGGDDKFGGIFWADADETLFDSLKGFHQYAGHTIYNDFTINKIDAFTSITYVDVINKPYILTII